MALTHHYIVQLASIRAGFNRFFRDYVLLGDDIVIANEAVALQYKILCSILDMPISEVKTHVSVDTFEFAKRWVHRGVEITGYSIGGLLETWKRYSLLHEFMENQQQHGWTLSLEGRPGFISRIYEFFGRDSTRPIKLYRCFYYIKNIIDIAKQVMHSNTAKLARSETKVKINNELFIRNHAKVSYIDNSSL